MKTIKKIVGYILLGISFILFMGACGELDEESKELLIEWCGDFAWKAELLFRMHLIIASLTSGYIGYKLSDFSEKETETAKENR